MAGFSRPRVLNTPVADLLVRVRGGANCSGTPVMGGMLVVTAAHCVLDEDGQVAASRTVIAGRRVVQAGGGPRQPEVPRLAPCPPRCRRAADVGGHPRCGGCPRRRTPCDRSGDRGRHPAARLRRSLLRGTRYDNRPHPTAASGPVVEIESSAAGCVGPAADLQISHARVKVRCGLIPGASGGGLFVGAIERPILVGVISTVAYDLSYNELVPVAEVHRLLDNACTYFYAMDLGGSNPCRTRPHPAVMGSWVSRTPRRGAAAGRGRPARPPCDATRTPGTRTQ